jgi:DNA-binding NarL/FixJ family response regulator
MPPNEPAIRVLLAEDHAVVRRGLEQLLSGISDIEVVGAAENGRQAVDLSSRHRPDVVVMDLEMPELDGIQATGMIRRAHPHIRVVILTSFSDQERILQALDAGAAGYLLKDAEPEELLHGIRAAARGESPLAPRAVSALLAEREAQRPARELSERQRTILALVATGKQNKHIALELGISEKTVKAHLTAIYQALGLSDRTQAALWAQRQGMSR